MAAFARADATALCRRLSGAGASGTGRRAGPASPPRVSRVARAMFDPGRRSGTATRTTSPPSAPPRGLAFTTDPSRVDAAAAAALMGRPDDPALVSKLRAAFDSPEGVVVAAFARVDDDRDLAPDRDRDRDRDRPTGRDDDPGDALRGVFLMGFDMLAGEGNVDGKTLVGFARAATDAAMVATVDDVVVHEAHRGRGVGRKLVRRLADELRHREIYDIGTRAPPRRADFFAACGFGPDAEGAELMALPRAADAANDDAIGGDPSRHLKRGGEGIRRAILAHMARADEEAAEEKRRWERR